MTRPIVLCWNMAGERAEAVARLAEKLGIRPFMVSPVDYRETLAALCGLEDRKGEPYEGEGFRTEMMLMAGFPKGMLNSFLDSFRDSGTPSVMLKAMLTGNNSLWDSLKLHGELSSEYEYFRRMQARENAE